MYKLKLFFSWQSDTKDNHKTISQALRNACEEIRAEGSYDIMYDESTWYQSGSPIIDSIVVEKHSKNGIVQQDIAPMIRRLDVTVAEKDLKRRSIGWMRIFSACRKPRCRQDNLICNL